jgi:uncharacterized protein YjbI with pentapeptide repeats
MRSHNQPTHPPLRELTLREATFREATFREATFREATFREATVQTALEAPPPAEPRDRTNSLLRGAGPDLAGAGRRCTDNFLGYAQSEAGKVSHGDQSKVRIACVLSIARLAGASACTRRVAFTHLHG